MLVAAVDESADRDKRLFALTAVVMDSADMARLVGRLEPYATANHRGRTEIHTAEQNADDRATVARIIDQDRGVRVVVTVRAAIEPAGAEVARQTCLSELLVRLQSHGVNAVTLDTRDDPRATDQQRRHYEQHDKHDKHTIQQLRNAEAIPGHAEFIVQHRASDAHKPLWVADALAWRVRRSIQHDQPGEVAGLSGRLQVVEARGRTTETAASATTFSQHLERLQVAAAKIAERDGIREPPPGINLAQRLSELDRRIAAIEDRGGPQRSFYTEQPPQQHHRDGHGLGR